MSSDLECKASVLWGTDQSEFLKARQLELIERQHWADIDTNPETDTDS